MSRVSANSIDAVSDRDFVLETRLGRPCEPSPHVTALGNVGIEIQRPIAHLLRSFPPVAVRIPRESQAYVCVGKTEKRQWIFRLEIASLLEAFDRKVDIGDRFSKQGHPSLEDEIERVAGSLHPSGDPLLIAGR